MTIGRYNRHEAHGLPERLDELVPRYLERIPNDVIDGKPLRYSTGSNVVYRIYSVGWNERDDAGQIGLVPQKKNPTVDASQGDWVWQMHANPAPSEPQ